MVNYSRTIDLIPAEGTHASRPAATAVPAGCIYKCSTHNCIYRSDGTAWATWAYVLPGGTTDADVATWDATAGKWKSATPASGGGSSPTIRASGSGFSTAASFSVTIPAGAQVGDLLVLMCGSHYGALAATGWATASTTGAATNHNGAVLVRTCVTGDPGSTVTVTQGGAAAANWHLAAIAGGTRTVEFSSTQVGTATATLTSSDLVLKGGGLLLAHASIRGVVGATFTPTGRAGESFTSVTYRGADTDNSSQMWSAPAKGPGLVSVTASAAPSPGGLAVNAINIV